jgi:hypothetical protein
VLPPTHRQHPTFTQLQAHTFMGRVRAPHASCRPPLPSFHGPAHAGHTRPAQGSHRLIHIGRHLLQESDVQDRQHCLNQKLPI